MEIGESIVLMMLYLQFINRLVTPIRMSRKNIHLMQKKTSMKQNHEYYLLYPSFFTHGKMINSYRILPKQ